MSTLNPREVIYWKAVEQVARACAVEPNPDRAFHSICEKLPMTKGHFRDVMDFGKHPSAFADWLGDPIETFDNSDWSAVTEGVTYMAFRADVLERVCELKESK